MWRRRLRRRQPGRFGPGGKPCIPAVAVGGKSKHSVAAAAGAALLLVNRRNLVMVVLLVVRLSIPQLLSWRRRCWRATEPTYS